MNSLQMPKMYSMKKSAFLRLFTAFMVWLTAGTAPVFAGYEYKFDRKTNPMGNFESEMSGKLTRGVVNTLFGWTELARTPISMAQGPKKNFLKVIFIGVPYGILRAGGRTLLGIYEIVTFFAPQKPIMAPIEGQVT